MNSCEPYQELISRLVDGEISREEHEALMAHLNTCSRCNAMYAVFHDLSDILSEEPEELPEGLHENIMASVRRSEMIEKNRRMRKLGLRMAMSAAACALLVLFAASGFGPGKRAEDVSLRTQEAAEQLYQAPAETTPAPTEQVFTLPVQTPAPTETPAAFAVPDAYLAAGNSVSEPAVTPLQQPSYVQYTAPVQITPDVYYYVGDSTQTGTGIYYPPVTAAPVQTAAPVIAQTPAPVIVQTPEPVAVQTAAPVSVQTPEPVAAQSAAPAAEETVEAPMLRKAESVLTASEDAVFVEEETGTVGVLEDDGPFAMLRSAPAAMESKMAVAEETEDQSAGLFLFSGLGVEYASDGPDEADIADNAEQNQILAQNTVPELDDAEPTPEAAEIPAPEEKGDVSAELPLEKTETRIEEQSVKVYGKEGHDRLLALLGGGESELPAEAELTRVVHVALWPDDAYGSEEKLDINIYGDFVYYRLYPAEGGAVSYRAACALRDLDSLLKALTAASAEPSPAPTVDPYAVEIAAA